MIFRKRRIRRLETHRMDIVGLPIEATYEEVRDTILEYSYTRYPVYEDSMDTIVRCILFENVYRMVD